MMVEMCQMGVRWCMMVYDGRSISQCGSHVGNVIENIGQNITFDRHVRGNKN
jgi:hypothetical protein